MTTGGSILKPFTLELDHRGQVMSLNVDGRDVPVSSMTKVELVSEVGKIARLTCHSLQRGPSVIYGFADVVDVVSNVGVSASPRAPYTPSLRQRVIVFYDWTQVEAAWTIVAEGGETIQLSINPELVPPADMSAQVNRAALKLLLHLAAVHPERYDDLLYEAEELMAHP
jgi:hypothetical protein